MTGRTARLIAALLLSGRLGASAYAQESSPPENPYATLDGYAASRKGDVSVAIRDSRGCAHAYNAELPIRAASIVKVPILATLLQKAADEGRDLTRLEQGLADRMIRYSDNDATTALWNKLGQARIMRLMHSIGLTHTQPDSECPSCWGYTNTTANDMLLLVEKLAGCKIASPSLCEYAMSLMTTITPDQSWGLKDGLPAGTWIAFKNGWYPEDEVWRVNSMGTIRPDSGAPYSMVVLTRYDVQLGMNYGVETIGELSRRVYGLLTADERGPGGCTAQAAPLPTGTYDQSCDQCRVSGSVLNCGCLDMKGRTVNTSLDVTACPPGSIWNNDGRLTCSE